MTSFAARRRGAPEAEELTRRLVPHLKEALAKERGIARAGAVEVDACECPGSHDAGVGALHTTKTMNTSELGDVRVLFVAGFGPIVREAAASRRLYGEALGIGFKEENGGYLHTEELSGAKTFALWPLSQAAQSCFGKDSWPDEIPAPQAWLEFDVDRVETATAALAARGYRMLVQNRKEPWGQIVSRFLSPEGLLIGITFTPALRDEKS